MRIRILLVLLFTMALLWATPQATRNGGATRLTNTWTGNSSTAWGVTGNWSLNLVPTTEHDVVIPSGLTRYPTIASGARVCINLGMMSGATLTVSGGSLTVSYDLGVDTGATLTVSGGTVTVQHNLGIQTNATATISSGTLTVNGETQINGVMNANNPGTIVNMNLYSEVNGTLSIAGAYVKAGTNLVIRGNLNISNNSSQLEVFSNLIFNSGAQTNTTDSANIRIQGNLETYSGSNVNLNLNTITFFGTGESAIKTYAPATVNNLTFAKNNPGYTIYHSSSVADLTVTGHLTIASYNTFTQNYAGTLHLHGNWSTNTQAYFNFTVGTLSFEGTSSAHVSGTTSSSRFNNVIIAKASLAQIVSMMGSYIYIMGNLTINSGVFQPQTDVRFYGNWTNNVGPDGYIESIVIVTAMGDANQTMQGTDNIHHFALEKTGGYLFFPTGSDITCTYFYQNGKSIRVNGGTLRSNNTYPYIEGTTVVNSGLLELHWASYNSMDLKGTLNISGGIVKLFGGNQNFQLANYSGNQFTMSGGVLDVVNKGINFSMSNPTLAFTYNITGGTIRTGYDFTCERTDFLPAGGTVELYGLANSSLQMVSGSRLWRLKVNKDYLDPSYVWLASDISIENEIAVDSGRLFGMNRNIYLAGTFSESMIGSFFPETSTLNACGNSGVQSIWVNNLYNLVDNNTGSGIVSNNSLTIGGTLTVNRTVSLNAGAIINVVQNTVPTASFTLGYTSSIAYYAGGGTLNIPSNCNLVISDLSDAGLTGNINVNGGILDATQDIGANLRLDGNLTITNNGTVHLKIAGGYTGLLTMGEISSTSLTMDSGSLNLHSLSFVIVGPLGSNNEFNITGGTLRCSGSWFDYAGTFDPTGGTVEFFDSPYFAGSQASSVNLMGNSWFYNLTASKAAAEVSINSRIIKGNLTVSGSNLVELIGGDISIINGGNIYINAGVLSLNGYTLTHSGNIYVNGELRMIGTSILKMANGMNLIVNPGGKLTCLGNMSAQPLLTHNETGYYNCSLESGSTLAAFYAVFEYMGSNGINLKPGSLVDVNNSLHYCTFRCPISGGRLLTINNSQTFTIVRSHIPNTGFLSGSTIYKNNGSGIVTFLNADGWLAGPYYEYDPDNQINWDWEGQFISVNISRNSYGLVTLDWESELEPLWYRIFRSDNPDGPFTQIGEIHSSFNHTYSEYPPAGNTKFYYVKCAWQ